ncbi:uncharacterized protein [Dermacentor andersoni]|uniref:uncharacterized protein isoform X2 n=1 Tax=Dermacentor andersoni TaxID=34620 RepID=UPI0024170236|nr:uncharacterized protein LOC126534603 isoform X2 [Dermacentor andersoni]
MAISGLSGRHTSNRSARMRSATSRQKALSFVKSRLNDVWHAARGTRIVLSLHLCTFKQTRRKMYSKRGYLKSAPCLNKAGDRIHKCVKAFREDLYRIALEAPPKQRIRYACCEYSKLFSCKQSSLRENCKDPKAIQYVRETAEHVLHNLVKVFCGRYESGSDECTALEKLPALNSKENAPKSFILLLKSFTASVP